MTNKELRNKLNELEFVTRATITKDHVKLYGGFTQDQKPVQIEQIENAIGFYLNVSKIVFARADRGGSVTFTISDSPMQSAPQAEDPQEPGL